MLYSIYNIAMEDFEKVLNVLLAMQQKHTDFFEKEQSLITDYVEFQNNKLPVLKIKNGLPGYIIDDIYDAL
ncbi:MAG: hypothetical protein JWR50_420 [Mucilaginibacter sp.]|nr:hypothetical protein [Mucilaginibacter sp.]